jgi:hypothetical protein
MTPRAQSFSHVAVFTHLPPPTTWPSTAQFLGATGQNAMAMR